jgi:iron uptake system EfeUOB component EfeO/EfeM
MVGVVATAFGSSAAAVRTVERPPAGRPTSATSAPTGLEAERAAASTAITTFHQDIDSATANFVADVGRLQTDVDAGALVRARADELAAQADYDSLRVLDSGNQVNASALDGLASDLAAGQSFGGLHAIERDLWSSGDAVSDVSGLVAQAPVAEFLLDKESIDPEAIGTVGVDELSWMDEVALPGREELYSHLDAVDIAASTAAAHDAYLAIQPLARRVAPSLTAQVAGQFTALLSDVAWLGPPTQVTDAAIPPGTRLLLSQQGDATATELAQLAATLVPFGTSGPPS